MNKLYSYQKDGVAFLLAHKRCILADDMGLGKTVQTIALFKQLNASKVLIVCPNSMKFVWQQEMLKWFPAASVQVIDGTKAKRQQQLSVDASYFIINYEALRLHKNELTRSWQICVLDEAHRVKNRKAQVTKAVRAITKNAQRIVQLTGTPIVNHASEFFSLLQILHPKIYTSYWRFVHKYCTVHNNGYGWVVDDILNATDIRVISLQKRLSTLLLRRTKKQVLIDLPEKTIQQIPVVLTAKQYKLYNIMKHDMTVQLEKQHQTVSAVTALSLITRLRQMAIDATIMLPDETVPLDGAKIDVIHDLIAAAANQQKIVIFSQFARVIRRIRHNLDGWHISYTGFTGQASSKDREAAIHEFQHNPQIKVFLTTISAGGQGISLSAASIAIFIDKAWAPAYNVQAQDRLHRLPQKHAVTIYELIAQNTVEQKIEKLLQHKTKITDLFLTSAVAKLF